MKTFIFTFLVLCSFSLSLLLCGCECDVDSYGEEKTRMPIVGEPPPHVQTLWKQGSIELDRIDGHSYLVGRISVGGYGSYGVCSIVHSPECPCYNKDARKNSKDETHL